MAGIDWVDADPLKITQEKENGGNHINIENWYKEEHHIWTTKTTTLVMIAKTGGVFIQIKRAILSWYIGWRLIQHRWPLLILISLYLHPSHHICRSGEEGGGRGVSSR